MRSSSATAVRHPSERTGACPHVRICDAEIVAGLRRRDESALEQLVSAYGPLLAHWARTQGSETEDVVQDVLFRVWKAGDGLDPETHLPGYLKTVTLNAVRNRWRTQERKPTVPVGLEFAGGACSD